MPRRRPDLSKPLQQFIRRWLYRRKPRRLHLFSTDKLRLDGGAEAKRNLVRLQRKLDGMVYFGVRWQTSTIYL